MAVVFLILLIALILLYLLSKDKYTDYLEPLEKKSYPLKDYLPAALFLLDKCGYKYATEYDKRQLTKLAEISGHKYSMYYLRIFWAEKLTYLFIGMLAVSLIGISQVVSPGFLIFAIIVLLSAFFIPDSQLKDKLKKRHMQIQLDFPDFLNKLTLLINAGMTITKAWEKIVNDNKKKSPLYDELTMTLADIRGGKPEIQAYEDFAKRCRMSEISRFVSVIVQNLRKGSNEIVSILRLQANECWEMRKHATKRMGEEASTKMLLPMMIMFIAVLIIVAVPAILSLQGL
jgi:Flp pilus assembly protein TadC